VGGVSRQICPRYLLRVSAVQESNKTEMFGLTCITTEDLPSKVFPGKAFVLRHSFVRETGEFKKSFIHGIHVLPPEQLLMNAIQKVDEFVEEHVV